MYALICLYCNIGNLIPCVFSYTLTFVIGTQVSFAYVLVFAARQLQEKCREQHQDLYTTFVDLTKAFDTVSRAGLWKIMAKYGCP